MNAADLLYISQCLGREPQGVVAVAARDRRGQPTVITNHPLQWKQEQPVPFPTLYWLIDPTLGEQISDIERRGAVGEIERVIGEDASLRDRVHADHRAYAATRWALLSAAEKQLAERSGFVATLRDKGVGGTANFDAIKCLHMHAAFHLAELSNEKPGTAVGQLLVVNYGLRFG